MIAKGAWKWWRGGLVMDSTSDVWLCPPFNIVSALTLNKGVRSWTSLVLLKMLSETWPIGLGEKSKVKIKTRPVGIGPRLKITNLKSNMEAFSPCILQSLKENFHFVFGESKRAWFHQCVSFLWTFLPSWSVMSPMAHMAPLRLLSDTSSLFAWYRI